MRTLKGLDFPHTCPTIDKALRSAGWIIDRELEILYGTEIDRSKLSRTIYREIESIFEDVRATNVEIREAADSQISALENEVDSLRDEVNELSARVEELERELDLALREDG